VPPGWFGRGSSAIFGLVALCVAVFVLSIRGPESGTRSRLLDFGAIGYAEIRAGELWRFLTAVFLHFDISHLLSNMAAMIVIAPPLAHQIGALRFLVVFLVGGVGANVVSYVLAPVVGLKAGASGGIAAVLGALGGLGLNPRRQSRYKPWQILGALAAFYGMTIGFGPGRDNVAHVAGLLIGIALGRLMEPPSSREIVRVAPGPLRSD
jgi:rhomboid protease GluP